LLKLEIEILPFLPKVVPPLPKRDASASCRLTLVCTQVNVIGRSLSFDSAASTLTYEVKVRLHCVLSSPETGWWTHGLGESVYAR
jgi:hypothetical protein